MIPPLGADTTGIHTMKYSEMFLWLNTDVLAEGESHGWLIRRGDDAGGEIQAFLHRWWTSLPAGPCACRNVPESYGAVAALSVLPKPRSLKRSLKRSTKRATRVLTKKSANPLPRFANRPSRKTFLRFARIPRTGALWRKLLGGSVRSRLESLHIWQARIPPHPTARHLCGSRCADITQ